MNVIKKFITNKAIEWADIQFKDQSSLAGLVLRQIATQGKLRDAQVESLKIYLWYKCEAQNKPLIEVFETHYVKHDVGPLRNLLLDIGDEIGSDKLKSQAQNASNDEVREFLVELLGGYEQVSNVLYSLPMGAGKTFVMASMIYIDLYFNLNNSDNRFAQNFLIFAPSGLKSSVIPSLRTIERFDPTWILPSDLAKQIQKQLKFVVLDVSKTAKKSNRIENPNARKVQESLISSDPKGYVFVTNAEKVILDKVIEDPYKGTMFEVEGDEKSKQENELRHLLARVPHLSILVDEVHHTQKEENKLRLVINNQFNKGNLVSITGFTGTPYFKRKVQFKSTNLTLDQIPNTIYHYELKNGVRNFLKQPHIKSYSSDSKTIVRSSLEDFYSQMYNKSYADGRKPKLAIYCASIERLEEEVLPIVLNFYEEKKLNSQEVLKYYGPTTKSKSGKKYTLDRSSEVEFAKLDTPYSKKRIILLCQIGKEGWDCQSLAGVVLSGEGDSPKNMVLQTSCRCLREVDNAQKEAGLIFLNMKNYKHLEKELLDTHKISIKEFELGKEDEDILKRIDRRKHLKLPSLEYNQFVIERKCEVEAIIPEPQALLNELAIQLQSKGVKYFTPQTTIYKEGFEVHDASRQTTSVSEDTDEPLSLSQLQLHILKASYGAISFETLLSSGEHIKKIHSTLTRSNRLLKSYQLSDVIAVILQAFIPQSSVAIKETIQSETVSWLFTDINKNPLSKSATIYPNSIDFIQKIEEYDKKKIDSDTLTQHEDQNIKQLENTKQTVSGDASFVRTLEEKIDEINRLKLPIKNKDRSFHYIPYDFGASKFEKDILENIFQHRDFQENELEVYFNGDRFLSNFKIKIYKKIDTQWRLIQDKYTPDFLIIKRSKSNKITKTLIIETKGAHLAHDFSHINEFMSTTFIEMNKGKFDFLYLEDGKDMSYHSQTISDKIKLYFNS